MAKVTVEYQECATSKSVLFFCYCWAADEGDRMSPRLSRITNQITVLRHRLCINFVFSVRRPDFASPRLTPTHPPTHPPQINVQQRLCTRPWRWRWNTARVAGDRSELGDGGKLRSGNMDEGSKNRWLSGSCSTIAPPNVSLTKSLALKPAPGRISLNTVLVATPQSSFDSPLQTRDMERHFFPSILARVE